MRFPCPWTTNIYIYIYIWKIEADVSTIDIYIYTFVWEVCYRILVYLGNLSFFFDHGFCCIIPLYPRGFFVLFSHDCLVGMLSWGWCIIQMSSWYIHSVNLTKVFHVHTSVCVIENVVGCIYIYIYLWSYIYIFDPIWIYIVPIIVARNIPNRMRRFDVLPSHPDERSDR
jgi:hypothetical protein